MIKLKMNSIRKNDSINDLSFQVLFKMFGWNGLILKPKFFIALLIAAGTKLLLCHLSTDNFIDVAKYISNTGASVSGTLLGIVIAGLAIITALSNGKLFNILLEKQVLHQLLFPFWLAAVFWGITLGGCMGLYPCITLLSHIVLSWIEFVIVFMFIYSTMSTVGLVGNTVQIGLILTEYKPEN